MFAGIGWQAISLWFQRLLQFFVPAIHAEPSLLSAGNAPLGLWPSLYAESRNKETEEKGQSPLRLPAVDTQLAVDCGSCVVPLPGRSPSFPNHPPSPRSHHEHATIHIAPWKSTFFLHLGSWIQERLIVKAAKRGNRFSSSSVSESVKRFSSAVFGRHRTNGSKASRSIAAYFLRS